MRKGVYNVKIIEENNVFIGISLGSDFVAEHEWGIRGIKTKLKIDSTKIGIEGRKIHDHSNVVYFEKNELAILRTVDSYELNEIKSFSDCLTRFLLQIPFNKDNITCTWDKDDFGIIANKKYVKELYDAFKVNDICVCKINSKSNAFANTSLSILIASRIPKDVIEEMNKVDQKAFDLIKYEEEIGLKELKTRNINKKDWLALSPFFINYEDKIMKNNLKQKIKTKYDIRYWVNYADDKDYGWFTVEAIKKWLETPNEKLVDIAKKL